MDIIQKVKIKSWEYIQQHSNILNPVPEMEQFCGKEATILDCTMPSLAPHLPSFYSINEDGGKYMWSSEWFENI